MIFFKKITSDEKIRRLQSLSPPVLPGPVKSRPVLKGAIGKKTMIVIFLVVVLILLILPNFFGGVFRGVLSRKGVVETKKGEVNYEMAQGASGRVEIPSGFPRDLEYPGWKPVTVTPNLRIEKEAETVGGRVLFGANIVGGKISKAKAYELGLKITTYWLYLPQFVNSEGNIDAVKLERAVEAYSVERGGLEVIVHLMPQTQREAQLQRGFRAPEPASFSSQVAQVAKALKGKVKYYSIGNEVPSTWVGSVEDYLKMLRLASDSLKRENREAVVLDSGTSSLTYLVLVGKEILRIRGESAALDFLTSAI